jgi:hypothetical protein
VPHARTGRPAQGHNDDGRISLAITAKLIVGAPAGAIADLDHLLVDPELPSRLRAFVVALRAVAAGSRDRSLPDTPDLNYMSGEPLCVIDALETGAVVARRNWIPTCRPPSEASTSNLARIACGSVATPLASRHCATALNAQRHSEPRHRHLGASGSSRCLRSEEQQVLARHAATSDGTHCDAATARTIRRSQRPPLSYGCIRVRHGTIETTREELMGT